MGPEEFELHSSVQRVGARHELAAVVCKEAQRVSAAHVWLSSDTSTGRFPLRFKGFKERVLSSAFPWGCGQDLEKKIQLGLRPKYARNGCTSVRFWPLISISRSLNVFDKLQWASGILEVCWSHIPFWESGVIPQHPVKHCCFAFRGHTHKELDSGFISVHFQQTRRLNRWTSNIFPRVHLGFIRPFKNLFSHACGIITPQSSCMT